MKKRILSILLTLCMTLCFTPISVFAEGETNRKVETEQELVDALADSSVDIITLKNDIAIGTTLTVLRKVTLNLNGYVLKMTGSGSVIILDNKSGITGDLTLIDSNPTAEHKFKVNGVEPWVLDDSGTETVYGGIITGGTGSRIFFSNGVEGGGVIIGSGALTMNGGNIVGCIANNGGGLFLSDGSFTMNAGSIVGCSTPNRLTTGEAFYGGIYAFGPMANRDTTGVITLTGGLIKNNGRYAINAVYKTTIYANGGEVYGWVYLNQACKITCLAEDNGITAFKGKTVIGGTSSVNPSHVDWGLFYGGLYIYGNTTGVIVTYKDGDSEYAKQVLPSGTLATRPDAPAATPGYTFGGWNKADGTAWDYASDKVTDNITLYAKWAANTYTITFDTAGGSEVITKTIEVTYGEQFGDMPVPKREGYVFLGWYDALVGGKCYGDSDGKSTSPYDKDVSITLYAQWAEAPSRMVYFNTCGGTMTGPVEVLHKLNTPIAKPDNPTKPGHTFNGWYTDSALTQAWNFDDWVTGELKLYAGWTVNQYTITFDTNGGSEIAPITQDYGTKITAPDNPTRKGYTFRGWDKEIPETMPAENITVKAQWEINQYTITFDTNGGSEIAPITQDYGTKITTPDNPTRKGYTFKGWDKEIPETMPAENITVKAQWKINQYTITFDTNGGSEIAPITQDYGTKITTPDNPTRKGYTFKGWDKEIPETMPAENITVKAQWEINQYTIAFDTNGGSEIAPITQDYGTEITAPDNPTRKGYTFKGWDKEIPETMPAENITVKAQWEINQYTITFDTNGGSEIAPITQDYGTEITAPDNPTRKGYTFKGWDKEIPETMPAENITVKAQWEINQYTIAFDTNGGSEIAPITQDYGTEITAPDNPTRKGYTFKGWDKEIPETMPAENITVKAQWEINQYTITFDTNGGSEIAPITQDYGTEITAPADPTRKGYTFKGWDREIPETMPAENITITARWRDTEKPTGEIIIGTNKWNEFLNKLTFGIFFKDTQEVTINAVDNSGVVFVSYLVTDKELSEAELNSLVFRAYEEPFCIEPNGEYIIYVMLVDENINITYLRSDRITLDNIQPVISGIENGKTYCEAQTVTVDEKYVDTVTVNGTAVTLDADGGFVLPPTNGEQKIVVTDKAGNNAEMTVTVNNGHTFGEWVSDNDGTHTRKCTVDGCDAFETENCSGGNATCTEKAVCDVCGKAYGEFDGTNHKGGVQEWTTRTAFNHEQKWNCCGAVIVSSEAHEWKDGVCRECGYVCLHNDADKDHVCDYCEKTISEHEDKDKNHICDYCAKTISEHEDKDKDHVCDYCEKTISAHEDATPEEIKKPDTVTAKPDDSKSPQTGDNSNLILWIALLIISGGVMKGVTAFGKSKKHSAKIKDK